jgi:hypothetical protein
LGDLALEHVSTAALRKRVGTIAGSNFIQAGLRLCGHDLHRPLVQLQTQIAQRERVLVDICQQLLACSRRLQQRAYIHEIVIAFDAPEQPGAVTTPLTRQNAIEIGHRSDRRA